MSVPPPLINQVDQQQQHSTPLYHLSQQEQQNQQQWRTIPRSPRKATICLLLPALIIAFPISIAIFALEELSRSILNTNLKEIEAGLSIDIDSSTTVKLENPFVVNPKPSNVILATSIVTGIFSIVVAAAFWELRNKHQDVRADRRARIWSWVNVIVTIGNLALVTACTIVVFLVQKKDGAQTVRSMVADEGSSWSQETILCLFKDYDSGLLSSAGCGFAVCLKLSFYPRCLC
jgi:hypothetical protein